MALSSKYNIFNITKNAWIGVQMDYSISRSGANVVVGATPVISINGSGGPWYNNWIDVDISIGGVWQGYQRVKPNTSTTILGKEWRGATRKSRTYSNTSTSVPLALRVRGQANDKWKPSGSTFSFTGTAPAAIPATPSASIGSVTRNSFKVSWTASMSATSVAYQLNGGTWVYPGGTGTSGAFNVTGLANGKAYTVGIQVQGPGGWSPTRTVSATTLHVSTMSSLSAKPRFGTNNVLDLTFARTQTGGTTSIRYRISGGSWSAYTTGTTGAISGLANNTSYTVQFEALNSSGQVNSYSTTGRTHAAPTGSFTLSQTNKKNLVVSIGAVANATVRRLSLNNGAWQDTPGNRTFTVSPATTYNVRMQLYSSTTGLTFTTGYQNITMASLAAISSFSVIARSRTSATIRMAFSDNVNQITLSVGTTSNEVQNITSGKTFDLPITKSGLVSGTNYTLTVKVRDTSNGGYNSNQSYTFSTAAFVKPTAVITPSLSKMTVVYTIIDSCKMEGSSTIRKSGEKVSVVFDKTSSGGALSAGTSYTFTTNFIDEFKTGNVPVAATATTSTIPTISSYNAVPNTISSLIGAYPQLGINLSDTRYEKTIRYTIGGKNYSQTVPIGGSQASHLLTKTQVEDILRTTPTTRSPVKVEVFFSEGGVQSPSTRVSTLDLTLLGTILNVSTPVEGSLIYSPAGGLNLTALVSSSINEMTATVPVQETPLGSTIVKEVLLFQNKVYTLNSSREVTISNVNTFNAGRTFQIEITDSRGLINRKEFAVSTFEYSNPVLSVSEIGRSNGGFGEDLIAGNLGATWSSPPTTGQKNYLNGVLLRVRNQAGVISEYGTIIPGSLLETEATGQVTKNFPTVEILSKTISAIGKVFLTNYSYRLTIVAHDAFGREAIVAEFPVSTGEPAMFIDSVNKVVGFSTVAPRGAAEVNGDLYATRNYSLNGLIFSDEDLVDL